MGLSYTSYFGLARVSDMGPEVKGWSVTDFNPQVTSLLLQALTQHKHGGATPIRYPGYNTVTPATPLLVTASEQQGNGGVLSPGATVGVRLAYVNNLDLETESSPELRTVLSPLPTRPLSPDVGVATATPVPNAMGGGSYVYAMTKVKGTGETQLSGISQMDVPFDPTGTQSYTVTLTFLPLSTFTDGTTSLRIYRATGLNADFVLLKTINTSGQTTYTDNGVVESNTTLPPRINTYDKNKYLAINWSSFVHPSDAVKLRVYVTQNPGVYGINHLLLEQSLTTPTYQQQVNYLGSETLGKNWPKEFSQLPNNPPKLRLNSEATGAPILTEYMDFRGYESMNFVLPWNLAHATPIRGSMYYDFSTDSVKIRLANGYTTLATPTGTYIHPTISSGGHNAIDIAHGSQNLSNVASIIANSSAGQIRKQVTTVALATPSPATLSTSSSVAAYLPEMQVYNFTPDFAGQWIEITFNANMVLNATSVMNAIFQFEMNGSVVEGASTGRGISVPAGFLGNMPIHIHHATPISRPLTVKVLWYVTGTGLLTSSGGLRYLMVKDLF